MAESSESFVRYVGPDHQPHSLVQVEKAERRAQLLVDQVTLAKLGAIRSEIAKGSERCENARKDPIESHPLWAYYVSFLALWLLPALLLLGLVAAGRRTLRGVRGTQ